MLKRTFAFIVMVIFFSSITVLADYRVFMLKLVDNSTQSTRHFLSTLDPEQYQTIYPLNPSQNLTYTDTWRCWGRSAPYQPYCDKPVPRTPPTIETTK